MREVYEIDLEMLAYAYGTPIMVRLIADGDIFTSLDGRDAVKRSAFSAKGWDILLDADMIGREVASV